MAAVLTAAQIAAFEGLFEKPSIDDMLQINWSDFQDFVRYVFECAGYVVEFVADRRFPFGPGVDLNLYTSVLKERPVARVEVRHYDPAHLLAFGDVAEFLGVLELSGGIPGYLVTTSGFGGPARAAEEAAANRVHLVDGQRLVRYIKYVGGSRLDRVFSGAKLPFSQPTEPNWLAIADALVARTLRPPQRPRVLAIANNKGGVGKSTTAWYLGKEFAKRGLRVLLVDMDAQTNLTEFVLGDEQAASVGSHLAGYFAGQYSLGRAIRPVDGDSSVSIVPAHTYLSRLDTGGFGRPDAEIKFVADLYDAIAHSQSSTGGHFDWVILDTPPATSLFTRAALAAADNVLVPARPRTSSMAGARILMKACETMDALMGRSPSVLGCVITHWAHDRASQQGFQKLSTLFSSYQVPVFASRIPMAVAIESSTHLAAHAIQAYSDLTEEVLAHADGH